MPEANTKYRDFARECADAVDANACLGRGAGSGGDKDFLRRFLFNLSKGDSIIPMNLNLQARFDFAEALHKIVGKGIVVIDNNDHDRFRA